VCWNFCIPEARFSLPVNGSLYWLIGLHLGEGIVVADNNYVTMKIGTVPQSLQWRCLVVRANIIPKQKSQLFFNGHFLDFFFFKGMLPHTKGMLQHTYIPFHQ